MKILGIGESVIDNAYEVKGALSPGKLLNINPTKHVGGTVLAAIIMLKRLGAECTLLTTIGKDENGEIIMDLLDKEEITVIPNYNGKTKVNTMIINTQNGFRKKVRGKTKNPMIKLIDSKFLSQFDAIIIDRHEKIAFYEILKKRKKSTKIFIDPSTEVSEHTLDMIKFADYPIVPIETLQKLNVRGDIRARLKKLYSSTKKHIVVTAGESGSLIYDGVKIHKVPPVSIIPVDVTGAGDVFRGGFTYGILMGWSMRKSAEFANYAAALQCRKVGNATAIPTKYEIETFMGDNISEKDFLNVQEY